MQTRHFLRPSFLDRKVLLAAVFLLSSALSVYAENMTPADHNPKPVNYIAYTESLASSGQPSAVEFEAVARAGVERVIYLAFLDHDTSVPNEDRIVRDLAMQFAHIPVVWSAPSLADFELFSAVMRQSEGANTLVHCQVNLRASSFVFLYRVIYQGVPMNDAVLALNSIWTPSEVWRQFIVSVLRVHNLEPSCEFCDALAGD
jgi:protein tyrosine phosphatase (PTP) superfamily phosphohydrolase (DUF442 family)